MSKSISILSALGCTFIWGTTFIAQDTGMEFIGPYLFNGVRFFVGFLVLLPFFLYFEKKNVKKELVKDRNEFFNRAWLEDTQNYLEYCLQDAELLHKIDEEMGLSEGVLAVQKIVKAPFEDCFFVTMIAAPYFMRNATWKAPTGKKGSKEKYDGAMIYNPLEEETNGLHLGVAASDFSSLYPSVAVARNISWETKSETETKS
mgnify:CR=1 FL=1